MGLGPRVKIQPLLGLFFKLKDKLSIMQNVLCKTHCQNSQNCRYSILCHLLLDLVLLFTDLSKLQMQFEE